MHPIPDIASDFRADLHCHTTCSDGSLEPRAVIDLALSIGLQGLSITDHDTVAAYEESISYAREKKLYLGTGVEFSCNFEARSVHVLGYDFCLEDFSFLSYCKRQQEKRLVRNRLILEKLHRLKIFIEESELFLSFQEQASTLGRPHIAAAMVRKGYVKSIAEAFQLYLGDHKSCYVAGEPFPVLEAVEILHQAGGKAFIAHPHMYADAAFVRRVLDVPFDGIECYYGKTSPDVVRRWKKVAEKRNLLMSGGSDFHGEAKPYVSLGGAWVSQDVFFRIFEKNLIV